MIKYFYILNHTLRRNTQRIPYIGQSLAFCPVLTNSQCYAHRSAHAVLCTSCPGLRPEHHTWPLMVAISQTQGRESPTHLRYQFVLEGAGNPKVFFAFSSSATPVSYTHLRAHETRHDLV